MPFEEYHTMNRELISTLRSKPPVALVGATNDPHKYGNIILRDLRSKGFRILPVNPHTTSVEDIPSYPSLHSMVEVERPGLLIYVIPPSRTLESLHEALALDLMDIWIQPGAGDDRVRDFLESGHFRYLMGACVMVET